MGTLSFMGQWQSPQHSPIHSLALSRGVFPGHHLQDECYIYALHCWDLPHNLKQSTREGLQSAGEFWEHRTQYTTSTQHVHEHQHNAHNQYMCTCTCMCVLANTHTHTHTHNARTHLWGPSSTLLLQNWSKSEFLGHHGGLKRWGRATCTLHQTCCTSPIADTSTRHHSTVVEGLVRQWEESDHSPHHRKATSSALPSHPLCIAGESRRVFSNLIKI